MTLRNDAFDGTILSQERKDPEDNWTNAAGGGTRPPIYGTLFRDIIASSAKHVSSGRRAAAGSVQVKIYLYKNGSSFGDLGRYDADVGHVLGLHPLPDFVCTSSYGPDAILLEARRLPRECGINNIYVFGQALHLCGWRRDTNLPTDKRHHCQNLRRRFFYAFV